MDLIGKKVKGFKFGKNEFPNYYESGMDDYVGVEGTIVEQPKNSDGNEYVEVQFPTSEQWSYPLDKVMSRVLKVPTIKQAIPKQVSDDGVTWYNANVLAKLPDGDYITDDLIRWKQIRTLE
jgi:hypothetical protein